MHSARFLFRIPIGVCFALAVAAILACSNNGHTNEDKNQFRDDVIWCEEAVARLERCCPNFDGAKVICQFYYSYDEGCGSSTTTKVEPALTKEESRCVRATSCEGLLAQGVCTRAEEAGAARKTTNRTSSDDDSGTLLSGSPSGSSSSTSGGPTSSTSSGTPARSGPVCP